MNRSRTEAAGEPADLTPLDSKAGTTSNFFAGNPREPRSERRRTEKPWNAQAVFQ